MKSSIITTIDEVTSEILKEGKITFTVSETGEIINTRLSASTGDSKIDKLIISTISSMPKWKPAVNSKGIKVAQEFQFNIGNRDC